VITRYRLECGHTASFTLQSDNLILTILTIKQFTRPPASLFNVAGLFIFSTMIFYFDIIKNMEYQKTIDKVKPELDKVLIFFESELAKIRIGRASISLIEDIEVECFGQKMFLKQLASISTPEARLIVIQPWDDSYIESIQKALEKANLGANPIADKKIIRIYLPPLSEEYRRDLIKIISEKKENARKTLRHWRDEIWKEIQNKERAGEISEDDKFRAKDKLQDLVDEFNEKIDKISEKKEKEII
jgi:ribosome recycling factor